MAIGNPTAEDTGAYVKFSGDSGGILTEVPELGDTQTFVIKAKAKQDKDDARGDGEIRRTVTYQIIDVQPGEIEAAPRDPQLALGADEDEL